MGEAEVDGTASQAPDLIVDVIVVAAGGSSRMGGRDKVFAELSGRPLLEWSLLALAAARSVRHIVVVAAPGREAEASAILPELVAAVATGGEHRGASVEAGFRRLEALWATTDEPPSADPVVLVHDGARPLLSPALVEAVAAAAAEHGAALPVVPVTDTLKRLVDGRVGETVDRSDLVAAQTPQGARASLFRRAFAAFPASGPARFTDEAALLEVCTIPVHPIPGDPVNLKVTVPADLDRAEVLLGRDVRRRVGLGTDSHPFGPGEPLHLGGIEIEGAPRLHGHSDGDVAIHAVADALLGAASLGDLGRLFPADSRTPEGVDSRELLGEVVARLAGAGWRPDGVDLTITGSRPRLAGHLEPMRASFAELLGLPIGKVEVKASTGNLDGSQGAGRGLAATAVATIVPLRVEQAGRP